MSFGEAVMNTNEISNFVNNIERKTQNAKRNNAITQ